MNILNNVVIRWTLLVLINVILSILFASDMMKTFPAFMGVMFGIVVFIVSYSWLDLQLLKKGKKLLRRALHGGVIMTAVLQCYPIISLLAGAIAIAAGDELTGLNINNEIDRHFFSLFIVTLIDGLLLSIIVFIMTFLIWFLMVAKRNYEGRDE